MKIMIDRKYKLDAACDEPRVAECFFSDNCEPLWAKSLNPCGGQCGGFHPGATVEQYAAFVCVRGQERRAGIHTSGLEFHEHFDNAEEAIAFAKEMLA